ncbi:tetratricopeptide repeat protein [Novosphingobium mangrovi (ex Huang et al. 2023)]|uniref:Tetratricopeptide repeat protein n=1 Tax=Novosphingobium mangrovi (ex Huang et al. 2023) TaxID=2976432 RepID=A0ABT2I6X5_9SPHN|nr:tetratricopeptide repeat protein [Novosphingobium mangrovi (ex Huang et al. 2023)]MCT2400569.1 tetratricopeptide repeat protein [Novosphingobium mangrovi (ex Huang et al. 2023)]
MTWVLVIVLALLAFLFMAFVLKAPRGTREAVAAALLLGIAGYALQGKPGMPSAPKAAAEPVTANSAALVEGRMKVSNKGIPPNNQWVVIADGLARNGRYADAAQVLRGAVEKDPKNSEAWLAMANALLGHADGMLTPAALYAYRRAAIADPNNPGPPFFLGLALAQSGRFSEARALWADLLKRAPDDTPWRAPLAQQLQRLDALISGQMGGQDDAPVSQP